MSTTLIHDLTIYKGTSFSLVLQYAENNIPVDMSSGWEAKLRFKTEDDVNDYSIGTETGEIILGNDGTVAVALPSTQTINYPVATYLWGIAVKPPDDDVLPPLALGTLTVIDPIVVW